MQFAEHLTVVDKSLIHIIYNNLKAKVGLLPDKYSHLFVWLVVRFLFGKPFLYLCRCHNTVRLLIDMYVDNITAVFLHTHFLLTERAEDIFHKSPVKEGTMFVCPCHIQESKFAHHCFRTLCGGNRALFLIEIDENL